MAEEPVSNLLKKHFQKVRECLQDKKNFDILTRYSFKFTDDKAIDNAELDTDENFINPELELSQKPGKCLNITPGSFSDTSIGENESEEFQAETDFENDNAEVKSVSEASSCLCNTTLDDNEERIDNTERVQLLPYHKISRRPLLERPETPMLNMYDSDDDSFKYDSKPRRMEGSQKFILYPEQLQAGDLNTTPKTKYLSEEKAVDRSKRLEILPKKERIISRSKLITPEENERAFHKELEMYKRDIKLEKTIQSLSCDANLHDQKTAKTQPQSCSCDQSLKTIYHGKKPEIVEKPKDRPNDTKLETSVGLDLPGNHFPEYMKNYFEEASMNVCQKSSHCEVCNQPNTAHPTEYPVDDEFFECMYDTILKNPTLKDESQKSHHPEVIPENFLAMNHLKIQKEMVRRIEDMYKTGDGR